MSRSRSRSRSPSQSRSRRRDDRRDDRGSSRAPTNWRDESTSLLVRNIDARTSTDELRKVFEAFGEIRDIYTPLDHHSKKPRGFGFIEFREVADARKACEQLNGATVGESIIEVVVAQQRRKSPTTMRRMQSRRGRDGERDGERDSRRRSRSREGRSRRQRSRSNDRRRRSYSR